MRMSVQHHVIEPAKSRYKPTQCYLNSRSQQHRIQTLPQIREPDVGAQQVLLRLPENSSYKCGNVDLAQVWAKLQTDVSNKIKS